MRYLELDKGLKVFDIRFDVTTAGPSPNDNKRIELFLLGCDRAMNGCPCKGCFNSTLWDSNKAEFSRDVEELANWIIERTPDNEKYITLGGGEPLLQIDHLIPFCKILKSNGFHIMLYTWRELDTYLTDCEFNDDIIAPNSSYVKSRIHELLPYIDMIVDGPFKIEERLYRENEADGLLSSIGSGNQKIWNINSMESHYMRDLNRIYIEDNDLKFELKEVTHES